MQAVELRNGDMAVGRHFATESWVERVVSLGTSIEVGDDLDASLVWRFLLPGSEFLSELTQPVKATDLVVMPILPIPSGDNTQDEVLTLSVHTGTDTRELQPFHKDRFKYFPDSTDLKTQLCVELAVSELAANPIVEVRRTTTLLFEAPSIYSPVDFLPISQNYIELGEEQSGLSLPEIAELLTVTVPNKLRCDHIAFRTCLEMDDDFENLISLAEQSVVAPGVALDHAIQAVPLLKGAIGFIKDDERRSSASNSDLDDVSKSLNDWMKEFGSKTPGRLRPSGDDQKFVKEAIDTLRGLINDAESINIVIPAERYADGSVKVEDGVGNKYLRLRGLAVAIGDSYVHIQRRPAKALMLLGLVQVAMIAQLRLDLFATWQKDVDFVGRFPAKVSPDAAITTLMEVRESAVAVLLFFPALLFADLVRSRPIEATRRQTRYRYTTLLSAGYFAPLVPVVALLGRNHPTSVVVALAVSAAVALTLGVLSLTLTNEKQLESGRKKVACKAAK